MAVKPRRIEYHRLSEIVPAARNPKGHALADLQESMTRFGFMEPLLMDERTGSLVGGHGRLETLALAEAADLPMPEGLIVQAGHWCVPITRGWASSDDDEAKAALIALNHLTELGGWNVDDLATMLDELREGPGLTGTGYSAHDLDLLLASLKPAEEEPAGVASIQPPSKPRTRKGDVWQIGDHRVMCGDCRDADDVAKLVDGRTVNLAFTSPPYAQQRTYDPDSGFAPIPPDEYVAWFAAVSENVCTVLEPDGSWFVNIKPPAEGLDTNLYVFDLVIAHVREWGWHFGTEYCWERPGVPKNVVRRFKNEFEPVYQFARGEWKMRPDAVRHFSENVPINGGPGVGDTSWKDAQGGNGPMFGVQKHKGNRGNQAAQQGGAQRGVADGKNIDFAKRQGAGDGGALAHLKPRKGGKSTLMSEEQGGNTLQPRRGGVSGAGGGETHQGMLGSYAPGEFIHAGMAYPGNRLPTFSGSHEATGHTAAFPVGLPQWFVKAYTDPGDVVYDPFVGSGSTIIAAHNETRIGLGMEISPKYVDVICHRLQTVTGITPVNLRTGRAHNFI